MCLRRLREWSETPVIVLSVRDDEAGKVAALDAGAEDYVTKPFSTPNCSRVCAPRNAKPGRKRKLPFSNMRRPGCRSYRAHRHARWTRSETDRHRIRASAIVCSASRARPDPPLYSARNLGPEVGRTPAISARLCDALTPKNRTRPCSTGVDQDRIGNWLPIYNLSRINRAGKLASVIEARAHGIHLRRDVVGAAQYLDRNDAIMGKSARHCCRR